MRNTRWFLLGIVVITLIAIYTDLPSSPGFHIIGINRSSNFQEGLDLKGGERVLLCAKGHPSSAAMSNARDIIENRAAGFSGLSSPQISVLGKKCIDAELPGIKNKKRAINTIGQTGKLELTNTGVTKSNSSGFLPSGTKVKLVHCPQNQFTCNGAPNPKAKPPTVVVVVPGKDVTPNSAIATVNDSGPTVQYSMNGTGSSAWSTFTSDNVGTYSAVVLDGVIKSDPIIQTAITGGQTQVTGLSQNEASELATLLNYGALPVSFKVNSVETVSATLGPQYVHKAVLAGIIGLLLVAAFMIFYYRLPGVLAVVALMIYSLVVLALFKLIPVTMTLPGIAGFILSIGMAVDANVLIFERLKEELRAGKTLGAAIDSGFNRAWTSIRDSNVSTMLTTIILFWFGQHFGTTIITSFAATLFIGVAVSMFTAISVSRTFLRLLVASGRWRSPVLYGIESRPNTTAGAVVA
jgi:preprotein translocase subunit SecD